MHSSDPMIEVILVIYFDSNPALTPVQKGPFQLSKMPEKILKIGLRDFNVVFDQFSGGIALDSRTGEGLRPLFTSDPTSRGHLHCQVLRVPQYLNPAL